MTPHRKKFVKFCMAYGYDRNGAERFAKFLYTSIFSMNGILMVPDKNNLYHYVGSSYQGVMDYTRKIEARLRQESPKETVLH